MHARPVHILVIVLVAALVCGFALPGLTQPAEVLLNKSADFPGGLARGPVAFSHEAHTGYASECTDCHHRFDNGKNVLNPGELMDGTSPAACENCHGGKDPAGGIGLQLAFHRQCLGCHAKTPPAGHAPGPRSCSGCHEVKVK